MGMSDRKGRIARLAALPVLAVCGFLAAATFAGVGIGQTTTTTTDPPPPSTDTTTTTTTTPPGDEGCTPGFWKNLDQHLDEWTGLTPGQTIESLFDVPDSLGIDSTTLIQVLGPPAAGAINGSGPNGEYQLLRHGVAGVLSANHSGVNYPLSAGEVIALVNGAIGGTAAQIQAAKNILAAANEQGCPL